MMVNKMSEYKEDKLINDLNKGLKKEMTNVIMFAMMIGIIIGIIIASFLHKYIVHPLGW